MDKKEIGRRIAKIRGKHNLTQKQFAAELNTSQGYISDIEKGEKKVGAELLFNIVNTYSEDLNYILTGESTGKNIIKEPSIEYKVQRLEKEKKVLEEENERLKNSMLEIAANLTSSAKIKKKKSIISRWKNIE